MTYLSFDILDQARRYFSEAQRVAAFWGPVAGAPALLAPFVAVASVFALAVLTGIAVGALASLIVALLALHALLTEVFGVRIELAAAV